MRPTIYYLLASLFILVLLPACTPTPPSVRTNNDLPAPNFGNAKHGKALYKELCQKCHKLAFQQNKKGPHLLGIYGAPAAELTSYKYSTVLKTSNWIWDAGTLDTYITDSKKALPDGRMRADGVSSLSDRQDIIAYLVTLPNIPASTPAQPTPSNQAEPVGP